MMQCGGRLLTLLCLTALGGDALAQANYQPGQTFTSSRQATPAPAYRATPAPVVYTPIPTVTAPRVTAPKPAASASKDSKPYNLSETKKPSSSPVKKTAAAETAEKRDALPVKAAEAAPAEVGKKAEVVKPAANLEEKHEVSAAAAVAPEPVNKLVITSRKTGKKLVALTYDDGPNPSYTPKLSEYLKANDVPATFFLCGNMVKEHPEKAKMLHDMGFELANHSYDHPQLTKLSAEGVRDQLQDTHDLIKEATGVDVKLMRPPYGAQNETVRKVCEQLGYKVILWDVDTEDWKKRPVGLIVSTIMKQTGDGSIILMHDRKHGGMDTVLDATKQAVQQLRAKGYKFVTVGELLSDGDPAGIRIETPANSVTSGTATAPLAAVPVVTSAPAVPAANDGILPAPPAAQAAKSY